MISGFTVSRIKFEDCKEWLLYKHYAHRIPSISYAFGLFDINNILQGICTFGEPANHYLKTGICGEKWENSVIELNRLVVNENLGKNMLSFFVSKCLTFFRTAYIIVSYADEGMNHFGYIYQACNFLYTGRTKERTDIYAGENKHSRHYDKNIDYPKRQLRSAKHRYVFFAGKKKFTKQMKLDLKYPIQPYPKGDNKNYDASYQPDIQGRLFL